MRLRLTLALLSEWSVSWTGAGRGSRVGSELGTAEMTPITQGHSGTHCTFPPAGPWEVSADYQDCVMTRQQQRSILGVNSVTHDAPHTLLQAAEL
mgnify:CR=1 FL=1